MGWFWGGLFFVWLGVWQLIGFWPATSIVGGVFAMLMGIVAISDEIRRRNL
jgi:hypothetical protein